MNFSNNLFIFQSLIIISFGFTTRLFMYKILLFFIAIICFRSTAFSQFNDSVHHHFSFASTAIYNKTKEVSSFVLNNNAGFEINQKKIAFNTAASWIYGKQQKKLSNNDVSVFANVDYLKAVQTVYYWALANFDESYSLKINYRFQSGVGVGYTFVKTPGLNLELSDGFLYETSDLTDVVLGKDIYQTVSRVIGAIAKPDKIQFVKGLPKTRSGKIMRRILRKIAEGETQNLGDTSTLLDPGVVDEIKNGRLS